MEPSELPKCSCGVQASLSFHGDRHWCPKCLWYEVERLRATVDKLPKCWRLDESGELVQDVPVVPNMRVWRHDWPTVLGEVVLEIDGNNRMRLDGQPYMYCGKDVSSTREAAEAAGVAEP